MIQFKMLAPLAALFFSLSASAATYSLIDVQPHQDPNIAVVKKVLRALVAEVLQAPQNKTIVADPQATFIDINPENQYFKDRKFAFDYGKTIQGKPGRDDFAVMAQVTFKPGTPWTKFVPNYQGPNRLRILFDANARFDSPKAGMPKGTIFGAHADVRAEMNSLALLAYVANRIYKEMKEDEATVTVSKEQYQKVLQILDQMRRLEVVDFKEKNIEAAADLFNQLVRQVATAALNSGDAEEEAAIIGSLQVRKEYNNGKLVGFSIEPDMELFNQLFDNIEKQTVGGNFLAFRLAKFAFSRNQVRVALAVQGFEPPTEMFKGQLYADWIRPQMMQFLADYEAADQDPEQAQGQKQRLAQFFGIFQMLAFDEWK